MKRTAYEGTLPQEKSKPAKLLDAVGQWIGGTLLGRGEKPPKEPSFADRMAEERAAQQRRIAEMGQRNQLGKSFQAGFRGHRPNQIEYGSWKNHNVYVQSPPPGSWITQGAIVTEERPVTLQSKSGPKALIQQTTFRNQAGSGLLAQRCFGFYEGDEFVLVRANPEGPTSQDLNLEQSAAALAELGNICTQVTNWGSAPDPSHY